MEVDGSRKATKAPGEIGESTISNFVGGAWKSEVARAKPESLKDFKAQEGEHEGSPIERRVWS